MHYRREVEAVLISAWLGETDSIPILDEASVALVRERVREVSAGRLPPEAAESLVLAASELAHNQRRHGSAGRVAVRPIERGSVLGVEVIAADQGPGLADPTAALTGPPSSIKGLGVGLQASVRLTHESDFDVRLGEGTCVRVRTFAEPLERRREIGVFGRPISGERISGDGAAYVREGDVLWLIVSDGLGHGELARQPTDSAIETFLDARRTSPQGVLASCHEALQGSRGGVIAVARIDEAAATLEVALAGNIEGGVFSPRSARRFTGAGFVVGSRQPLRKVATEQAAFGPRDVLVLFSDGVSRKLQLDEDAALLVEHPFVIAHQVMRSFGKDSDDAIVLVVR